MAFLVEQERLPLRWPAKSEDRTSWQRAAKVLRDKMKVAEQFTKERIQALSEDSELYFELCEAKEIAMSAHALAVRIQYLARFTGEEKFTSQTAALRSRCDNLKCSIKHIFSLLDEGDLAGRLDRAM
jgi:hypothetical protein